MEDKRLNEQVVQRMAMVLGESVEEVERKIKEQEQGTFEAVRLLSAHDVIFAIKDVLCDFLGDASYFIGPVITERILDKLFYKEEGEE